MKIVLNQLLNAIWTILGFSCVLLYWIDVPLYPWFYLFMILSVLGLFVNPAVYKLSKQLSFYEKIGVKVIKKFVQDGDLVNKVSPAGNFKIVNQRDDLKKYLSSINMYEKYHVLCFVFFSLTTIHSLVNEQMLIALGITASNVFYNFYPVALQQYNRAKIVRILKL
jgi:hypothetical protein